MPKSQIVADEVDESVQEPTLRETIEAARDEVVSRQESSNDDASAGAVAGNAGEDQTGSADRGTDGRFLKKPVSGIDSGKESGIKESVLPAGAGSAGTKSPVQENSGTSTQVAPRSWKSEEKALWSQVPPAVQAIINRRESDVQRQIAQQGQIASIGNEFMQVANEYAPIVQARGGNPVAMFKDFMRIMGALHNAPDPQARAAVFQQVAAQQGVDLRALGIQAPSQQGNAAPPQGLPIQSIIQAEVDRRWNAWQQQLSQKREEEVMQQTSNEIEVFKSKVDEKGNLLYPHFDTVTSLMASLINSGAASTLSEAYPLAVRAHPETSKLIEQEQKAAAEAAQAAQKVEEERKHRALKAQRAAGSVRGSPGGAAPNGKADRSVREELQAAFAEARGRV